MQVPGLPIGQNGTLTIPNIPNATIDAHMYTVNQEKEQGIIYMFSYADYPKGYITSANLEIVLDGAREGALANSKATLLHEEKITKGRLRGRELKAAVGKDMIIRGRMYLFNNRLYQAITISRSDNRKAYKYITKFLDSFRLL